MEPPVLNRDKSEKILKEIKESNRKKQRDNRDMKRMDLHMKHRSDSIGDYPELVSAFEEMITKPKVSQSKIQIQTLNTQRKSVVLAPSVPPDREKLDDLPQTQMVRDKIKIYERPLRDGNERERPLKDKISRMDNDKMMRKNDKKKNGSQLSILNYIRK